MPTAQPVVPPISAREQDRIRLKKDELGKIVLQNLRVLRRLGWRRLIRTLRQRGDLQVDPALPHPAGPLLQRLQHEGAPAVMTTPPWSRATLDERVARGSHQSCAEYLDFLREELLEFSQKGFWLVLPVDFSLLIPFPSGSADGGKRNLTSLQQKK